MLATLKDVFFWEPEVNQIYNVRIFPCSHQEIIRFYVSMKNVLFMDDLYTLDHLLTNLQHCFQR